MRSFKTIAATGLAMATLIASVTVAGAMQIDPVADLFDAGTDEEIVNPTAPAYDDPYEAVETEIWEARRDAELKANERNNLRIEFEQALEAARAVDPFEAAFIEQVMAVDGQFLRSTSTLRITNPTVPAYADSYEAFENEVWERELARAVAELERETALAALAAARAVDPFEAAFIEQVIVSELPGGLVNGTRTVERAGGNLPFRGIPDIVTAGDGFIDIHGDMVEFALGVQYDRETPPRAANPVVTIGANDFDEQLIAFALQNEVGAWTPPTVRTAAVSGVDPYEEHGRLIDYVLHVEMSE